MTKESSKRAVPIDEPHAVKIDWTAREMETLELLLEGRSTKEIAYVLNRSPRTIQHRVDRILEKAGVSRRLELIVWAYRNRAA